MNGEITSLTAIGSIDRSNDVIEIVDVSMNQSFKVTPNNFVGIVTGVVMSTTDTQTVQNKTFDVTNTATLYDNLFTLQDGGDATKQLIFQLSGITTGNIRTVTIPDASGTMVLTGAIQTLTGKTLIAPVISGGTIDNAAVTVDAVAGHTTANTGTIYGISVTAGTLGSAAYAAGSVNAAALASQSVTPAKLNLAPTTNNVSASGTTTSTSFTATLSGSTASTCTVVIGTNGLLLVGCSAQMSNSTTDDCIMGVALSGANTVVAASVRSILYQSFAGSSAAQCSGVFLMTGLSPGSTVLTANFMVSGGTGTYVNNQVWGLPL